MKMYHSVQNHLSSSLLPRNIKIVIYTEIQFCIFFYISVKPSLSR